MKESGGSYLINPETQQAELQTRTLSQAEALQKKEQEQSDQAAQVEQAPNVTTIKKGK